MFAWHKKPQPDPKEDPVGLEITVRISEPLVDKSIAALRAGTLKGFAGGILVVVSVLTGAYALEGREPPSVPT